MVNVLGFLWIASAIFGVGFQFFFQNVAYLIMYRHAKFQKSVTNGSVIFSGKGTYVAVFHKAGSTHFGISA